MFKTDKKSLEKLSFLLDEKEFANFKNIVSKISDQKLLSVGDSEIKRVIDGLDYIGKLKMEGRVYAFHMSDFYGMGAEGVELYLRQGNRLEDYFVQDCRGDHMYPENSIRFLKEMGQSKVYTGPIFGEFLGLHHFIDEEDPYVHSILEEHDIYEFESRGIEVVMLDSLI